MVPSLSVKNILFSPPSSPEISVGLVVGWRLGEVGYLPTGRTESWVLQLSRKQAAIMAILPFLLRNRSDSMAPMEYHYSNFITYRSNLFFILIYRLERISSPKKVTFNIIKQMRNGQSCSFDSWKVWLFSLLLYSQDLNSAMTSRGLMTNNSLKKKMNKVQDAMKKEKKKWLVQRRSPIAVR